MIISEQIWRSHPPTSAKTVAIRSGQTSEPRNMKATASWRPSSPSAFTIPCTFFASSGAMIMPTAGLPIKQKSKLPTNQTTKQPGNEIAKNWLQTLLLSYDILTVADGI